MSVKKRELEGHVLKNKMDKTVVVVLKQRIKHKLFKKYFTVSKKYKAHDEKNECQVGDKVLIRECSPISKEKRWAVVKILERQVA